MTNEPRLRFAPSPTGFLHIGGLRTALFSYIIAQKLAGKLILRIEDTDTARTVEGATEKLLDIFSWIGIEFDESPIKKGDFGPYIQTQRFELYKQYVQDLLDKGEAYYCFCSSKRLEKMREEQKKNKQAPRYDGHCRNLSSEEIEEKLKNNEPYVIRQKMPLEGEVKVYDEIRGEISFQAEELEDHILIKSDGYPTYQFASVVDDHLMEITHVTRGEEWIPSFPKNVLLYKAFGWEVPKFIHLPLILNKEGGKLSKRQNDVAVESYKDKGYLPAALINFTVLLGWHPKHNEEILSMSDIVRDFEIEDMRTSPAVFDVDKLDYFNAHYIRKLTPEALTDLCLPHLKEYLDITEDLNRFMILNTKEETTYEYIKQVVSLEQERIKKLSDITELVDFFFQKKLDYETDLLLWKKLTKEDIKNNLELLVKELEKIEEEEWDMTNLEKEIVSFIRTNEYKVGDFLWPLRVALTGKKNSPGPFEIAAVLGKEVSLKRIERAIEKL